LFGQKSEDSHGGQERYLERKYIFKIGKIQESDFQNQETKILVNFIGDSTHAEVPISKIEKFERKFEEFSKTKKKTLINAINIASNSIKIENTTNTGVNNGNFRKQSEKVRNLR